MSLVGLNESAVSVLCSEFGKFLSAYHDRTSQVLMKSIVEALVKNYSGLSLECLVNEIHDFAVSQKKNVTT